MGPEKRMNKCTISGCRNLEWKCSDCGRTASTDTIANIPGIFEWISVQDKLPKDFFFGNEPSPEVLVSGSWGIKVGHQFNCGEWVDEHIYTIDGVTHWMPLPKPPEDK